MQTTIINVYITGKVRMPLMSTFTGKFVHVPLNYKCIENDIMQLICTFFNKCILVSQWCGKSIQAIKKGKLKQKQSIHTLNFVWYMLAFKFFVRGTNLFKLQFTVWKSGVVIYTPNHKEPL